MHAEFKSIGVPQMYMQGRDPWLTAEIMGYLVELNPATIMLVAPVIVLALAFMSFGDAH